MQAQTLYDLLGVAASALKPEIAAAYKRQCDLYDLVARGLSREEADLKLKVLKQAFEVLSDDASRARYDAKLRSQDTPAGTETFKAASPPPLYTPAPPWPNPEQGAPEGKLSLMSRLKLINDWMSVGLKFVLTAIGSLLLLWLIVQMTTVFMANRRVVTSTDEIAGGSQAAREKTIIQEYYQETGVRAASVTEVELLRAEERRKTQSRQQQQEAERNAREQERNYQRFIDESRQVGADVSANLRRAEEEARRIEEAKKSRAEQEERIKLEEERARVEAERNRWRSTLLRGGQ